MKFLKWISLALLASVAGLAGVYYWYTSDPYQPLPAMYDAIEQLDTAVPKDERQYIHYTAQGEPQANIVLIPGGLVTPEAYQYLAASLAAEQFNVTIVKATRNLAIMSANRPLNHLHNTLPNYLVGHSLGGTVAAMHGQKELGVAGIVLLASYGVNPVNVPVLSIVASNDEVLDPVRYEQSQANYTAGFKEVVMTGGNHGQFGWYGEQEGDGAASISVLEQHQGVVNAITEFINSNP